MARLLQKAQRTRADRGRHGHPKVSFWQTGVLPQNRPTSVGGGEGLLGALLGELCKMKRTLETEGCGKYHVLPLTSSVDVIAEPQFPHWESQGNNWPLGTVVKITLG